MPRCMSNTCFAAAAVLLAAVAICGPAALGADDAAETASWPVYHGDPALSGAALTTLPDSLSALWRYNAGSGVGQTPVVGGGSIFVVTDAGEIHAITMTGKRIWRKGVDGDADAGTNSAARLHRFTTPPMLADGAVVVGTSGGWLHALEVRDGSTRWKYRVGESIKGSANRLPPEGGLGPSVVVISQTDGVVHRIDLASGRAVWTSQPVARSDGSPGVGNGFLAFGSCDSALHVLSTSNGVMSGTLGLGDEGQIAGGVAVSGDLVFAGDRGGTIVCADAVKSKVVWTNHVARGEAFATPAIAGDRVVTGASDGFVHCLDRAGGKVLWRFEAGDNVLSPVVAGDKVVVAAGGTLYLLRTSDGTRLWAASAGDLISSPAVCCGKVIVGTDDGSVIMYGPAGPAR
ncbi:MAG: PQQ-binding-like beta-propeller repeat protein [bacterium]